MAVNEAGNYTKPTMRLVVKVVARVNGLRVRRRCLPRLIKLKVVVTHHEKASEVIT
mgnify:CR=1 FL=1